MYIYIYIYIYLYIVLAKTLRTDSNKYFQNTHKKKLTL